MNIHSNFVAHFWKSEKILEHVREELTLHLGASQRKELSFPDAFLSLYRANFTWYIFNGYAVELITSSRHCFVTSWKVNSLNVSFSPYARTIFVHTYLRMYKRTDARQVLFTRDCSAPIPRAKPAENGSAKKSTRNIFGKYLHKHVLDCFAYTLLFTKSLPPF